MSEKFIQMPDRVVYQRILPLLPDEQITVEVTLSNEYLNNADQDDVRKYLNQAVAAILTRNGVEKV